MAGIAPCGYCGALIVGRPKCVHVTAFGSWPACSYECGRRMLTRGEPAQAKGQKA